MTPHRRGQPQDGGDRRLPDASASTAPAPARAAPASASSTTCSTCSPATAGSTSRCRSPATSRPARTTRSRTPASCSARRSTARSATAPGSPATATRWSRWTRRARPARSTSPAARYCAWGGLTLPPGDIAGFEHEAAEEFFRAVASAARLTLHLELQAGTNAHHMIEACFKAFARALRAAVAVDPDRDRRPVDQGHADVSTRRGRRLRDGQPALGREGARARRRRRPRDRRPRRDPRGRRRRRARRRRASRRRCGGCRRPASTA